MLPTESLEMAGSDIIQLLGKRKPVLEFIELLTEVHPAQGPGSNVEQPFLTQTAVKAQIFVLAVGLEVGNLFQRSRKKEEKYLNKKIMTPVYNCKMCKENVTVSSLNSNSNTCHTTEQNIEANVRRLNPLATNL